MLVYYSICVRVDDEPLRRCRLHSRNFPPVRLGRKIFHDRSILSRVKGRETCACVHKGREEKSRGSSPRCVRSGKKLQRMWKAALGSSRISRDVFINNFRSAFIKTFYWSRPEIERIAENCLRKMFPSYDERRKRVNLILFRFILCRICENRVPLTTSENSWLRTPIFIFVAVSPAKEYSSRWYFESRSQGDWKWKEKSKDKPSRG